MTGAEWASLIAGLGGAGISAYVSSRNSRRQADNDAAATAQDEQQSTRNVALQESLADPFRHQRSQYQNLYALDALRQFGQGGPRVTPPANVAPYAGQVRRGYTASPSMQQSIDALEQSIRSGQTAPTMTDPANYGRTSVVNINAANGGPGVGAPLGGTAGTRDAIEYLPSTRRGGGTGGVGSNAGKGALTGFSVAGPAGALVGGIAGGIYGGVTHHADSAPYDLTVDQARQALQEVYQSELGRAASPEEIDAQLRGQGWNGQSRWVGEDGMRSVIRQIQNSVEARNRRAGVAA